MFTLNDINHRSVFVINTLENKTLRVRNGELLLENTEDGKVLTKLPFQKILALYVIGNFNVTSPLLEKCKQFGVALAVLKPNFRPIIFFSDAAEANYLLRRAQYEYETECMDIAVNIVDNKLSNQYDAVKKTRLKTPAALQAMEVCKCSRLAIKQKLLYNELLGWEGVASKVVFNALFGEFGWNARRPRVKSDPLNATLDIGYTILFNFIETFVRLFGFDPYVGVYHRLWFRRKSLICDLMEPFRPIIDLGIRKAWKLKTFSEQDFNLVRGQYYLDVKKNSHYTRYFFDLLVQHKSTTFEFIRNYYRYFMKRKSRPLCTPFSI